MHIDPMFREPAQLHNYKFKAKATQVLYNFLLSEDCDQLFYHTERGSACHSKVQKEEAGHKT